MAARDWIGEPEDVGTVAFCSSGRCYPEAASLGARCVAKNQEWRRTIRELKLKPGEVSSRGRQSDHPSQFFGTSSSLRMRSVARQFDIDVAPKSIDRPSSSGNMVVHLATHGRSLHRAF